MIGTVQSVNPDGKRGSYDVTEFVILNEKGETKEYAVFKNAPAHNNVVRLQEGDQVEISFVKKGKFYNVDTVEKIEAGEAAPRKKIVPPTHGNKDADIRRAVCLKAAIELCAATATSKTDLKALAVEAVEIAPLFDPYLKGEAGDPFEE
jgi:hypothetical protein